MVARAISASLGAPLHRASSAFRPSLDGISLIMHMYCTLSNSPMVARAISAASSWRSAMARPARAAHIGLLFTKRHNLIATSHCFFFTNPYSIGGYGEMCLVILEPSMRLHVMRGPEKFISLGIFLNSGASSSNMVCGNNSRSTKTTRGKYHITSLESDSAIRHSDESLHSAESTMFRSLKAFRYSSSIPHTQRSRLISMKETVLSLTA